MNRGLQKEETKKRIQKAAISLFQQQGYQKTTVSQITHEAGVAKGTFFNYFKTKEEVLHYLGINFTNRISYKLEQLLQTEESTAAIVKQLFLLLAQSNEEANPHLIRSWFYIAITNSSFQQSEILQIEKMRAHFTKVFQTGQDRGELIVDIPAEEMASIAILNFFGTLLYWCTNQPDSATLQERIDKSVTLLFRGFLIHS
ncbi:TetR/AcrR family transcriptional regulator [Priestia megaterium]|uniref:TetR/AcrR family transcriptional regulator n=1 Tax=Priestia megaterium TaxID=1404 RepID=UPI0021AC5AA9|nr:TetR/AcrR family transcriptional regulator [Priestia megaterium]MCR8929360.1 TetR/AcrR family transcriptional regulator [Priestia megaterium]